MRLGTCDAYSWFRGTRNHQKHQKVLSRGTPKRDWQSQSLFFQVITCSGVKSGVKIPRFLGPILGPPKMGPSETRWIRRAHSYLLYLVRFRVSASIFREKGTPKICPKTSRRGYPKMGPFSGTTQNHQNGSKLDHIWVRKWSKWVPEPPPTLS